MTLDGLTLAAMATELDARLGGGRVQKIVQPDPEGVALEVYNHHERAWLVLSANPQSPRVYLATERPGRGVETPSPLLLLLRKHIQGRRVGAIRQPPGERVLWIDLEGGPNPGVPKGPPFPAREGGVEENDRSLSVSQSEEQRVRDDCRAHDSPFPRREGGPKGHPGVRSGFRLIIEAISQYSNLILLDSNGIVLEAARRVTAEQNRTRVTLPRHPYVPPPPQRKRDLAESAPGDLQAVLDATAPGAAIWQALVGAYAGIGPLAGREVVFRALGDARAKAPAEPEARSVAAEKLAPALRSIVEPVRDHTFTATVALDAADVVAFAPYAITHLGRIEERDRLSAAADAFYRQQGSVRAVDLARRDVLKALASERAVAEKKRDALRRALDGTARADELRQRGELLLTYATAVPRGAARFRADGIELELDPRSSAVENAQALFRRYRKAKAALREVPILLAETELRLRYLDELAALAELAETTEEVRALRADLRPKRERPDLVKKRRRVGPRPDQNLLRLRTSTGHELLVGRSARQNQYVTFELARPDDLWLHAHGVPGAHVILRASDGSPPRAALEEAAAVAARYSASRASSRVQVDWTPKRYVRPLGKGTPGLVTYANEQTVVVKTTDERRRGKPEAGQRES